MAKGIYKPEEGGGWQLPDMNVLGIDTAYTARARCSCSRRVSIYCATIEPVLRLFSSQRLSLTNSETAESDVRVPISRFARCYQHRCQRKILYQ
jgi:hypothetical protein